MDKNELANLSCGPAPSPPFWLLTSKTMPVPFWLPSITFPHWPGGPFLDRRSPPCWFSARAAWKLRFPRAERRLTKPGERAPKAVGKRVNSYSAPITTHSLSFPPKRRWSRSCNNGLLIQETYVGGAHIDRRRRLSASSSATALASPPCVPGGNSSVCEKTSIEKVEEATRKERARARERALVPMMLCQSVLDSPALAASYLLSIV